MKVHKGDKFILISKVEQDFTEVPDVYRVIDSTRNNAFVVKKYDPKSGKYSSRRYSTREYSYGVKRRRRV